MDKPFAAREDDVVIDKEIVFNSNLKFSGTSVIVNDKEAPKTLPKSFSILKGAPEKILPKCSHYFSVSGQLIKTKDLSPLYEEVNVQSHSGIRVVAIAVSEEQLNAEERILPEQMTLIGLIGLRDEIRKESKEAIQMAKNAGIQVVMITGDRKETAISIAREVGLLPETHLHDEDGSDRHLPRNSVFTSEEINKMTEEELISILPNIKVIARALPTDKSRLVALCQKQDRVVGMTGDGVNDAAALSRADVGFAMGSGTEMAKEAADIVIMDDNFISITKAILYGRTIFRSIRKFITFQSTINVASTLIVFLGPFLGIDFPLTLIQLLWVNLVMDTLAALAFGGEPALARYMHDKPIRRDEAIVSPEMYSSFLLGGTFIAGMSIAFLTLEAFKDFFIRDGVYYNEGFLTGFFGFFIFITTLNAFNVRTRKLNVLDNIFKNPGFILVLVVIFCVQIVFTWIGGSVLRTVPLNYREWVVVISFSFIIFPFDLMRKVLIAPWLPKRLIDKTGLEHIETKPESPAKKNPNNLPKKQTAKPVSKERTPNPNNSKEQKNKATNKNQSQSQTSKDRKTNSNAPSKEQQKKQNKPKNQ
uniref:Cation-transporting P-type ATPase C-terminal domain-containing protein n=1 Tax=Arcella intermedia TaxID=1963864 RepID=A0A6B2L0B8_9EUKA